MPQVHRFGYHHIMHPGHRTPLKVNQEGVASATVVAPTAAAADAVATAAIVAGSVAKSSEFLLALCKAGVIAGFCLLSRSQAPVFHGAMFEPTGGAASANLSAEIDVAKQPSLSRAAPLWASFSDALGQAGEARVAQVSCKGRTTEVRPSRLDAGAGQPRRGCRAVARQHP